MLPLIGLKMYLSAGEAGVHVVRAYGGVAAAAPCHPACGRAHRFPRRTAVPLGSDGICATVCPGALPRRTRVLALDRTTTANVWTWTANVWTSINCMKTDYEHGDMAIGFGRGTL